MAQAKRDQNYVTTLLGVTDDANQTPVNLIVDPITKRLKVSATLSASLEDLSDVVITTPQDGDVLVYDSVTGNWINEAPAGGGDVVGPASSTNNALAVFDGTTGKLLKNSTFVPTTLGGNLINIANPSAITFPRFNADNTVSSLSDSDFRTAIGAQATGNYITALTGDVTATGPGSAAATIANDAVTTAKILNANVTYAKIQNVAQDRILGRITTGAGVVEELTGANVRTIINVEDGADVTDTTNVTAAGALMDSELTDIAAVKALNQGVATTDSPQFAGIELGNATDTTLSRVSAGVLAVEGVTVPTISSTNTLTNKRIQPRVRDETSGATHTINIANEDQLIVTAQAEAFTIANPTNMEIGETVRFQVIDNGTTRAITYGNQLFNGVGQTLSTTTTVSKEHEFIITKIGATRFLITEMILA